MPPDRRQPDDIDTAFRDLVNDRLDEGSRKMKRLEEALTDNTAATQRVEKNTQEIVEFFDAMKGGMKVLETVGRLAKPITAIIILISTTWGAIVLFLKRGV